MELVWVGDQSALSPLPSLFSAPSVPPVHPPRHSRAPGLPGEGLHIFPEVDPTALAPGTGMGVWRGCCHCAGLLALQGSPHHPLPLSGATGEGKVPAWGFIHPLPSQFLVTL